MPTGPDDITPEGWRNCPEDREGLNAWPRIVDCQDVTIALFVEQPGDRSGQAQVNAAYAARAVNAHAALVALARKYLREAIAQGADVEDVREIDDVLRLARGR